LTNGFPRHTQRALLTCTARETRDGWLMTGV
jgi:hypothetical protein